MSDDFDDDPAEDFDDSYLGEECGRWVNGKLGPHCSKAGSEECDWECPYRDRSFLKRTQPSLGDPK